jgi:hypothetical protein
MLKNKDVRLYVFENGKFIPAYDKKDGVAYGRYEPPAKVNIKYLGHDKANKFIHVQIYTYNPKDPKYFEYWFNTADVKL